MSSWRVGFNTFARMLLKSARAVARGRLHFCFMPVGAFTLPCGRLDVGLSQLKHVFLLDSFLSTCVPHLLPCAAPLTWCTAGTRRGVVADCVQTSTSTGEGFELL